MCPMYDLDLDYENIDVRYKVLIFGGWKPHQNLADIQMIDTKEEDYKNIGKFAKQLLRTKKFSKFMSASSAYEAMSSQSTGETGDESEREKRSTSIGPQSEFQIVEAIEQKFKSEIKLKFGDKFTKKPV